MKQNNNTPIADKPKNGGQVDTKKLALEYCFNSGTTLTGIDAAIKKIDDYEPSTLEQFIANCGGKKAAVAALSALKPAVEAVPIAGKKSKAS